ncbi:MAG: radical SAM protein [Candidatus Diapherotrites archaeon]|nr:radical SAM protein [Candidatus Diapherotrites archaeon]
MLRDFPVDDELEGLPPEELWKLHEKHSRRFRELWKRVKDGSDEWRELSAEGNSLLDLKVKLAHQLASPCILCERRCAVERRKGKMGVCKIDYNTYVHSAFLHLGEEAPLIPSGTIFYGGCNFACVFCQNHEISQEYPQAGEVVNPRQLAAIQDALYRRGARNINHVGGDPTPNLHTIAESLLHVRSPVPQLWNSNFYMSSEAMEILVDLIDIWLPDFKYGNDRCALRLSGVKNYVDVVLRNLKLAVQHGDMIIRHLVLPNHVECCSFPVLEMIAKELPKDRVLVNIMDQYRPMFRVLKYPHLWPDVARPVSLEEVERVRRRATELGLLWEPVSR